MAIDPANIDTVTIPELDTIELALTNLFAHSAPNGKMGKASINALAVFIAPYVASVGASGYIEVTGDTLPTPVIDNGFSIVGKGTYTHSGGNIVATGVLNIISWNGTTWSLVKEVDVDLSDYATKSDLANGVLSFKVDSITYENPRGSSELYGNEAWFSDTDGGKNGIGAYMQMAEDTIFNKVEFSAAQTDSTKSVTVRVYKSQTRTNAVPSMQLLEEVVFPAGTFNRFIDAAAIIELKKGYQINKDEWIFVFALSSAMSWKFWNVQSATPPLRDFFIYTIMNTANPFETQAWGFASSGFQAGLKLTATNKDLKDKFADLAGMPDVILPSKIYAKRLMPSILYYNSFMLGIENTNKPAVYISGDWNFRGESFFDCFKFTPGTNDTTGQNIAFRFYDSKKNLMGIKVSGVTVVANQGLTQNKKIIFAGNSLTAPGIIGKTVIDNIAALGGAGTITTHGTREEGGIWQDGWSGQNISWFIRDPASPFTNADGVLDIPLYLSTVGATDLDLLNFMEMTNTVGPGGQQLLPSTFEYTDAMNDLKTLCTAFLNAGTKKIILQIEPSSSLHTVALTPTWVKQSFLHNCQLFKKALLKNFDNNAFHPNVYIGFAGAYISRDKGYGSEDVVINPRFPSDTRKYSSNDYLEIHPIEAGQQSMGDGITPQILFHLQELDN